MVDTAAVVKFTLEKLGPALLDETLFLIDVPSQFKELHDELRRIQCFLKDADAKQQQGDERVRNWVADIRNVAYDVEDVVDTFMFWFNAGPESGGIQDFIIRKASMVKNLIHLHRVGKDIQAIQSKLKAISESRVTYGINNLGDEETSSSKANRMIQQQLRNHYIHVEDDVIGLEEHTKTLLTELLKDDERRCVVSVVGVGGLGKTTLAKKIYKHDTVRIRFDCHAWTSISQQLNVRDTLLEIIKKSMNPKGDELRVIKELNDGELVEKLYNYLQDKRYLIVVDDLWSFEDWNMLSPALPNGKTGSKVLLTTRNKEVADQADPSSLQLEPQLLTDEESWELLHCPAGLENIGREMVRKCGGLPLAICVLGGILATKKGEIKEWEHVNKNITTNFNKGKNGGVMGILALSYDDLPIHLKPCFLYLGLFPEDYAIPRKKLIQLWIAEGFIPQTRDSELGTMEEVGKREYLAELIQRCMVQADEQQNVVKACRIHDLMRDLCLSKAREMNFLDIYDHHTDDITSGRLRRYAIHLNDEQRRYGNFYFNNAACALRTLFAEIPSYCNIPSFNYQNIKLLRVLDLENGNFSPFGDMDIIKEVSELIHLRYLALRKGKFYVISSSIGNLISLQTLKLVQEGHLPDSIMKLVQLRHLEIRVGGVDANFRIENFINLQTLEYIRSGKWIYKGCLRKLSKLRKLGVLYTSRDETDILINEIVTKRSSSLSSSSSDDQFQNPIKALKIESSENFDSKIFDLLSCCHNLRELSLNGKLDILNLQKYPSNLSKLTLHKSEMKDDPMETLQYLPNLTFLDMMKTYVGEEMICSTNGFPQLQVLRITLLDRLKKFTVEQGGMPCLKELYLNYLKELCMLPEGLRFITTLKKLDISSMKTIRDRVVRDVGEDWCKVQHIPTLIVNYW
ncbi:hypothetical protein MKW92_048300 [Papaver armeniacum]|nr:hypothetical protein MKW92_048300 [Papaver armeniacum]